MLKALSNDVFNHSLRKNICSVSRHLLKGIIFEHLNVEHKKRTKKNLFLCGNFDVVLAIGGLGAGGVRGLAAGGVGGLAAVVVGRSRRWRSLTKMIPNSNFTQHPTSQS